MAILDQRGTLNSTASKLMYGRPLVEPISGVMQRKMLLGIKQRVEVTN